MAYAINPHLPPYIVAAIVKMAHPIAARDILLDLRVTVWTLETYYVKVEFSVTHSSSL